MSKDASSSSVMEFLTGLLTIAFTVLKITKYIDWSWSWVLSPIWIIVSLKLSIIFICFLYAYIRNRLDIKKQKKTIKGQSNKPSNN